MEQGMSTVVFEEGAAFKKGPIWKPWLKKAEGMVDCSFFDVFFFFIRDMREVGNSDGCWNVQEYLAYEAAKFADLLHLLLYNR